MAPCGAGIPSLGFAYPVVAGAIRCADGLVLTLFPVAGSTGRMQSHSSVEERSVHTGKVAGSNPVGTTTARRGLSPAGFFVSDGCGGMVANTMGERASLCASSRVSPCCGLPGGWSALVPSGVIGGHRRKSPGTFHSPGSTSEQGRAMGAAPPAPPRECPRRTSSFEESPRVQSRITRIRRAAVAALLATAMALVPALIGAPTIPRAVAHDSVLSSTPHDGENLDEPGF